MPNSCRFSQPYYKGGVCDCPACARRSERVVAKTLPYYGQPESEAEAQGFGEWLATLSDTIYLRVENEE